MAKNAKSINPNKSAFVGFLFSLPFILTNFIVALRIEPFYSFLGSFPAIRNNPLTPLLLLLLFPVGVFIAIRPMLHNEKSKRKLYFLNILVAVLLLIVFVILTAALGEELYRCEVLRIPNCD